MQLISNLFRFLSGTPALIGLLVTALVIFLAADWRVELFALLVQYVLVGLALAQYVRPEFVLVKILTGILVTVILQLSARRIGDAERREDEEGGPHLFGLHVGWLAGPLGFPLRLMAALLVVLFIVRAFASYNLEAVPMSLALLACWMAGMGILGLVLSRHPLRVSVSVLTLLAGFDLVFSALEPSLAMVGFLSAFYLLGSLGFSYLTTVHYLAGSGNGEGETRS